MNKAEAYKQLLRKSQSVASEVLGASEIEMWIHSNQDKDNLLKLLGKLNFELPVHVVIKKADSKRRLSQNDVQHAWYREAARQGDMTYWEYRCFCKLHFGVPIMRRDSKAFRDKYDMLIKPLTYEFKLEYMKEPCGIDVTSLMTVKQMSEFLDEVYIHLTGLGMTISNKDSLL